MGKLTELIRRATRAEPEPLGFGAGSRKPLATMLLLALAGDRWARAAGEAVAAGADAVLLAGRPGDRDVTEAIAAVDGRPCGILAPDANADQLSRLSDAGLDFAVVGPQAPANALLNEKLTLVLHLREDLTDVHLRALQPLPLDAIYVERETTPATIMRLIELQRLSGLSRKPVLLAVPPDSQQEDLVSLRDAGVALVALDLRERNAAETLRRLRETIDGLPRPRRPRREERPEATLPGARASGEPEVEDGEEDDED